MIISESREPVECPGCKLVRVMETGLTVAGAEMLTRDMERLSFLDQHGPSLNTPEAVRRGELRRFIDSLMRRYPNIETLFPVSALCLARGRGSRVPEA